MKTSLLKSVREGWVGATTGGHCRKFWWLHYNQKQKTVSAYVFDSLLNLEGTVHWEADELLVCVTYCIQ